MFYGWIWYICDFLRIQCWQLSRERNPKISQRLIGFDTVSHVYYLRIAPSVFLLIMKVIAVFSFHWLNSSLYIMNWRTILNCLASNNIQLLLMSHTVTTNAVFIFLYFKHLINPKVFYGMRSTIFIVKCVTELYKSVRIHSFHCALIQHLLGKSKIAVRYVFFSIKNIICRCLNKLFVSIILKHCI